MPSIKPLLLRRPTEAGFAWRNRNRPVIPMSPRLREIVDGLTLGDGSICSYSSHSGWVSLRLKSKQFIEFVRLLLESIGFAVRVKDVIVLGRPYLHLWTHSNAVLRPERLRWYPEERKVVPTDLILTPMVALLWYLGDGSLHQSHGSQEVRLHTDCFIDQTKLISELARVEVNAYLVPEKRKYTIIRIPPASLRTFFEFIGEPPFTELAYKWPDPDSFIDRSERPCQYCGLKFSPGNLGVPRRFCGKQCMMRSWRLANREHIREYQNKWFSTHRERKAIYNRRRKLKCQVGEPNVT